MPRIEILHDYNRQSSTGAGGYRILSHRDVNDDDDDEDSRNYISRNRGNRKSIIAISSNPNVPSLLRQSSKNAAGAVSDVNLGFNSRRLTQKKTGRLFTDPDFAATKASIFPSRSYSNFEWKRPKDICRNPQFISDGASRFDVRQGELGDCWLLAAIASLSLHTHLFDQVVPRNQDFGASYCGMFRFRLWQFGEWVDVVVDDLLPTRNGKLVFMHSTDTNEFWSALLEKAFAKLHGSYEALSGGNQPEAMEDFTGGLCEAFCLNNETNSSDIMRVMKQASMAHSLMGCSIEADEDHMESRMSNGLIMGHAYSITGMEVVKPRNSRQVTLVRVRNPWGNEAEWTGDWGDRSSTWNLVDETDKRKLGFAKEDDGEFWMSFDDFFEHFNRLDVCHLGPESMGAGAEAVQDTKKRKWEECIESGSWKRNVTAGGCRNNIASFHMNPQYRVEIVDPDEDDDENLGTIIIGLMQKDVRRKTMGNYFTIGYAMYALRDPNCGPLDETFFKFNRSADRSPKYINQREVCGRHKLPPGHYVIMPTTFEANEEADFILRMFSEKANVSDVLDTPCQISDDINDAYERKGQNDKKVKDDEPLRNAFLKFAGVDAKIHARQLQKILNVSFAKGVKSFEGFSLESCRSLLALTDTDMSGFMEFEEFKLLWNQLRKLKSVFKDHDADGNGYFNCFELRAALKHAGYLISNKVFEAISLRYTDYDKGVITFEDYILLSIRLHIAFDTFDGIPKVEADTGVIKRDHFLLQTMYL